MNQNDLGREHAPVVSIPAIPELPADATPEQREEHWRRYIYQGDRTPQFTVRAVLMGGAIGMLMSISNLYTTLQLGWAFGVAITACVISYTLWNALRALSGNRLSPMSILENNCMQSTASAAGYSTGSTLGTCFGAMLLIQGVHVHPAILAPFVLLTGILGVFLAVPLKRQMINVEQLRFPSGIAAAETLRSLYSEGREAIQKAYALLIALGVGASVGLARTYAAFVDVLIELRRAPTWLMDIRNRLYIPEIFPFPTGALTGLKHTNYVLFGFEPSALLLAAGVITGLRVSLSILGGSLLLHLFVAPPLIAMDQQTPNSGWIQQPDGSLTTAKKAMVHGAGHIEVSDGGNIYPIRWALWGGSSVLVFASLASVALQWRQIARSFASLRRTTQHAADVPSDAEIEVPASWMVAGLLPTGLALIALLYIAFHVNPLLGLIATVFSFVIALVCCRATGETDTTPIGAMGKVTQFMYAGLAPGNTVINLVSAGVTANAGSSSSDLLTDLKSGYLLGANPRRQFLAQFVGIFFGTLAVVPAWYLMAPTKERLEKFALPNTQVWRAVAEAMTEGLDKLPQSVLWSIAVGGVVGIGLQTATALFPRAARFMPSAIGLGLAWVIPFTSSLGFATGAILLTIWQALHRRSSDQFSIPIASGLIAGESLAAAGVAIAASLAGLVLAAGS